MVENQPHVCYIKFNIENNGVFNIYRAHKEHFFPFSRK